MTSRKLPLCKYGSNCYRKNPDHLKNFSHPTKSEETEKQNVNSKRELEIEEHSTGLVKGLKKKKTEELKPQSQDKEINSGTDEEVQKELENFDEDTDIESPPSPENLKESIKVKCLVEMPEDFYLFWDFCCTQNSSDPHDALKCLKLKLAGPFDIMAGKHKKVRKNKYGRRPNFLLHHRYYYDPPEFQTLLVSEDSDCLHFGYFRDDPKEKPVFVASNTPGLTSSKEKIIVCGDNLFSAVHIYASKMIKSANPFTTTSIQKIIKSLEGAATKYHLNLSASSKEIKNRQKKVVCPSFHGAGIVVPVDDNEIGYRPVPETPGDLRAMFKRIADSKTDKEKDRYLEQLQELITLVQFANDECDYGEGLELGMDLFCFGGKIFHPQISILLPLAYQLLNRSEFSSIITAHLGQRKSVGECVDELISD